MTSAIFEDFNGERIAFLADKGFVSGLADSMVKEGQRIEFQKLPKTDIGKGRTMNQYDFYALD